jgi:hypothetical protein
MPHLIVSDAKVDEADKFARTAGNHRKALAAAAVRRDHEQMVKLP